MYAPLEFVSIITDDKFIIGQIYNTYSEEEFKDMLQIENRITRNQNNQFITRQNFILNEDDKNTKVLNELKEYYKQQNKNISKKDINQILTDQLLNIIAIKEWSKCKQVYLFQKDFFNILKDTELTEMKGSYWIQNVLKRLPYNSFYINLENCNISISKLYSVSTEIVEKEVLGTFVNIFSLLGGIVISFTFYAGDGESSCNSFYLREDINYTLINDGNQQTQKLNKAMLNCLLYLCANNRIITESEITKKTYKPSTIIKNKFSEIQQWDVNVRYGNSVGITKTKKEKEDVEDNFKSTKNHKSPRPHMRCAHWQLYHIGPGRKETELKWILSTFVNQSQENAVTTIHTVK